MGVAWALFREIVWARNLVFLRVKWFRPAMTGTSGMRRVRLRSFACFFLAAVELWLQAVVVALLCAQFKGHLESWVADRNGMAAWLLPTCVSLCIDKRPVGEVRLQNVLYRLHGFCISFILGYSLGTKPYVFLCKVALVGNDRYLGCVAGAAAVALTFFSCQSGIVASSCCGCASVCAIQRWLLPSCVAKCIEKSRLGTWGCTRYCSGCTDIRLALFWEIV